MNMLRSLYEDETIVLRATRGAGTGTFAESASTYSRHLDENFKGWGLDGPGKASSETQVSMKEMMIDSKGTFADLFAEIGNIEKLVVPQEQARNFGIEHPDKLHTLMSGAIFVPFTRNDEPANADLLNVFVARVCADGRGLGARAYPFSHPYSWRGVYRHRFVFRKQ